MESLQTRYKHERAYVNLVTQFDTASVNSIDGIANKNAINMHCEIFIIINFPCSRTPLAQNYFAQLFLQQDFSFTQFRKKYYLPFADRNCKFIAARFFFDVSSKKEPWSSSADPLVWFCFMPHKTNRPILPLRWTNSNDIFFLDRWWYILPWRLFATTAKFAINYFL